MLGQTTGGLVELAFTNQHLHEGGGRTGRDRARCGTVVRDARQHPARRVALSRRRIGARGLEPRARALGLPASFGDQLEHPALGLPRLAPGHGAQLVCQPPECVHRDAGIRWQRALERLERAERIAPPRAQIGLEPPGRQVVLVAQPGQQIGPHRVGSLAQRAHGGHAIPRNAPDRGQPLAQRPREVAVGEVQLRHLGSEGVRPAQLLAAAFKRRPCPRAVALAERGRAPLPERRLIPGSHARPTARRRLVDCPARQRPPRPEGRRRRRHHSPATA